MNYEAGPDQAQDQSDEHANWQQQWVQQYQEYWDQVEFPATPAPTITIQVPGRCVGRDKTPVPADDVWRLAALGCKDIEIADWFGIDSNTLRYNFSVELLKGRETLKQSLRRKQIEVAMAGNPTMLIFLGKNHLGQSDAPLSNQEAQILPWSDNE